jgi:hypothetical protein
VHQPRVSELLFKIYVCGTKTLLTFLVLIAGEGGVLAVPRAAALLKVTDGSTTTESARIRLWNATDKGQIPSSVLTVAVTDVPADIDICVTSSGHLAPAKWRLVLESFTYKTCPDQTQLLIFILPHREMNPPSLRSYNFILLHFRHITFLHPLQRVLANINTPTVFNRLQNLRDPIPFPYATVTT